jgi:hypothetical protein
VETAMTSDLITTVAMIAHDPLIGGSVLIAFGAFVGRLEAGRGLTTVELDRTLPTRGSSAWFSRHIRRLFELNITN